MKKIISIIIVMFFSFNVYAASSKFAPTILVDENIEDNKINVILGFEGEYVTNLKHDFSYDRDVLKLEDIFILNDFTVDYHESEIDGKYNKINFNIENNYEYIDNYAVLVFNVEKIKNQHGTYLFTYNYEGLGLDSKYRSKGVYTQITRESNDIMISLTKPNNKSVKNYFFFMDNLLLLAIAISMLIIVVISILLIPSKYTKEKRDRDLSQQIKEENYDNNSEKIKIDYDEIENIGKEEKVIDKDNIIEFNKEIDPFKNNKSKFSKDNQEKGNKNKK